MLTKWWIYNKKGRIRRFHRTSIRCDFLWIFMTVLWLFCDCFATVVRLILANFDERQQVQAQLSRQPVHHRGRRVRKRIVRVLHLLAPWPGRPAEKRRCFEHHGQDCRSVLHLKWWILHSKWWILQVYMINFVGDDGAFIVQQLDAFIERSVAAQKKFLTVV